MLGIGSLKDIQQRKAPSSERLGADFEGPQGPGGDLEDYAISSVDSMKGFLVNRDIQRDLTPWAREIAQR